ncbi:hypothetical protein NUW54_g2809 [Trametes sanguinea]|uniref:Uncharacterized protein n=1 Tax=Trametes sanguinea TaxID=158606 RepID=A0ACC1Q3R7_9APHY|nr:hypothetical protein NUW54_g2809 [Trametes sanguinea]
MSTPAANSSCSHQRPIANMDSGLPPALISATKESLSYQIIGCSLATALFGITLLQAYIYYRRYVKDSVVLKIFVATLVSLRVENGLGVGVAPLPFPCLRLRSKPRSPLPSWFNASLDLYVSIMSQRSLQTLTLYQWSKLVSRKNIAFTATIFLLAFGNFGTRWNRSDGGDVGRADIRTHACSELAYSAGNWIPAYSSSGRSELAYSSEYAMDAAPSAMP